MILFQKLFILLVSVVWVMKSVGCVTDPGDTEQYYHALRNLGAVGAEQRWRIFYQTFCCVYLIWRPFVVSKLSTQALFPSTSSLIVIFSASSTPCTSLQYKIIKMICNSHVNCNKSSGIFLVDLKEFKREQYSVYLAFSLVIEARCSRESTQKLKIFRFEYYMIDDDFLLCFPALSESPCVHESLQFFPWLTLNCAELWRVSKQNWLVQVRIF